MSKLVSIQEQVFQALCKLIAYKKANTEYISVNNVFDKFQHDICEHFNLDTTKYVSIMSELEKSNKIVQRFKGVNTKNGYVPTWYIFLREDFKPMSGTKAPKQSATAKIMFG